MADLVRYLRDTGGIVAGGRHVDRSRAALPDVPSDLPESVRGMIARKIEQVDEQDRRLLLAASVQGIEFDSAIVGEALADGSRRKSRSGSRRSSACTCSSAAATSSSFPTAR